MSAMQKLDWKWPALIGVALLLIHAPAFSVEITDQTILVANSGKHIGMGWSEDGRYFIVSEYQSTTHRQHLCIYKANPLARVKCLIAVRAQPDWYVGPIAWTGNTLYVDEGYVDGRVLLKYDVEGWEGASFREIDGAVKGAAVGIEGSGGWPAWDRWEGALYFQGDWATGGIYVMKDGKKMLVVKGGFFPVVSAQHLWFVLDEPRRGVFRSDRATKRQEWVADGAESISVTLNGDLLLVRNVEPKGYRGVVFAYRATNGEITRAFEVPKEPRSGVTQDVREVAVSPNGQYALAEIYSIDRKKDSLKFFYSLVVLKLKW